MVALLAVQRCRRAQEQSRWNPAYKIRDVQIGRVKMNQWKTTTFLIPIRYVPTGYYMHVPVANQCAATKNNIFCSQMANVSMTRRMHNTVDATLVYYHRWMHERTDVERINQQVK